MSQTNHTPPIKLIVLDIDGTLLNSRHELSERNERALKDAIAAGAQVVLATGKSHRSGEFITERTGIKAPGIYLQGLAIYDADGKILYQQTLAPAVARQVITFADERGFYTFAYSGEHMYVRKYVKDLVWEVTRYHEVDAEAVGPLQNLLDNLPINKLMPIGEPRAVTALRWQLNAQLNGSVTLMQAGLANMLEVLPPGGSKGTALWWLMKHLRIAPEHVMAMGDAENDMELLRAAGLGVAVGNADPHLKAVARHVVGTNDEDGVAQAIERFVLRRAEAADAAPAQPTQPTQEEVKS